MDSKNRIISAVLIAALLVALLPMVLFSEDFSYEAMNDGSDIIKNASYTDVSKDANVDSILKMSVYSVIREYGNTAYKPGSNATRENLLASIIRAIGKQDQAVKLGDALKQADKDLSTTDAYLRGHVDVAESSGIITAAETADISVLTPAEISAIEAEVNKLVKANWKMTLAEKNALLQNKKDQKSYEKAFRGAATREETAIWIARALNLKPISGEETMSVYAYSDWKSMKTENLPYIEAVLRSGIMKGASAAKFSPSGSITKSEMASIMDNLTNSTLGLLGYKLGYGKVSNIERVKSSTAYGDSDITTISIQTPNGDNIEISVNNKTQALPVIKAGKVGSQTLLSQGDVVEYTISDDENALLLHVGKYKEISGSFDGYDPVKGEVSLTDSSFKKYTLKVMPDTLIKAGGVPVNITKAPAGTGMTAIYNGNTLKSMDLQESPENINAEEMYVKILFADTMGNIIKIADENGNRQYLNMTDSVSVSVNGLASSVDAIGFDQDALLKVSDGKVVEVNIYTDMPEENPERQIIFTGRVREIVGENIIITKDAEPDKQETYIINDSTAVYKNDETTSKSSIKQGDRIKAYISSLQDNYITKLEVQGEGLLMKNIYKGDLQEVNSRSGEIVLSNVYTYGYYDWVKVSDYVRLEVADSPKIYKNGSALKLSDLEKNIGKTLYAASKENYGDEELVHIVMKEGYEDALYKKIDDIKWTANQMTLSDGRLVSFTEGAIIIKDGRLLDTLDLTEDSSAFIIQNKSFTGIGSAPIISLDSFNGFLDYKISKGYLHNMGEDYYSIENSYRMTNNSWEKYAEMNFYFSDDTFIMDSVKENGPITADKFAESRFKPYTYTWPNYETAGYNSESHSDDQYHKNYSLKNTAYYHEHCLIYTITDAYGNSQAINIFKKDKESFNPLYTHTDRMITGKISSLDIDNELLSMKQVMDYSSVYETWQPVKAEVPIDLGRVIILKNDKIIEPEDLAVNDSIYVLANEGYAIFIIVQ
ncbi:MAG: S-layer homology domain-containing protein [Bacillota bacterium]